MQGKGRLPGLERRIHTLAAGQHGRVTRRQLLALGLGAGAIDHRLGSGRLTRIGRGVYSVGVPSATQEGRWLTAVLSFPQGAALSHLSAAALWELRAIDPAVIDVVLPSRSGQRPRVGIRLHRPTRLHPNDSTRRHNIPVTTVARTLIDLAEVLGARSLERALDEAEFLRLLDRSALSAALERNRGRTGAARLAATLARHDPGSTRTRSALEEAFLLLTRRAGLPQPEVNARLGPWTIDFLWRERRLAVETDGGRSHNRKRQRESDSARNAWLIANDYRPLRLTWVQVTTRPEEVLEALKA